MVFFLKQLSYQISKDYFVLSSLFFRLPKVICFFNYVNEEESTVCVVCVFNFSQFFFTKYLSDSPF